MTIFDYLDTSEKFYKDETGNVYMDSYELQYLGCITELGDGTGFIPKDTFDKYCAYSITIAQDQRFNRLNYVRRPYYRMRGKSVTREQAFDIIRRTDDFFSFELDCIAEQTEFVRNWNFNNWLIAKNHLPQGYGWIHVDGTVGGNAITQKYPTIEEFVVEWFLKLMAFPYLNLIIAVTGWDELSQAEWEKREPREEETFENAVILGIYVHDKQIEILNREDTLMYYKEYDERYGHPAEKFEPEYYEKNHFVQVDEAYLRKCIEAYGMDPDEVLKTVPKYTWKEK